MKRLMLGGSVLCLALAACSAEPVEESQLLSPSGTPLPAQSISLNGSGVEMVKQAQLGPPASLNPLPQMGGGGGGDIGTWDQGLVYAFRLRTGQRVDRIELAYYIPTAANDQYTPGDHVGVIGPFGGSGGGDSGWIYCAPNHVAVGIHGRHGNRVDKFGLICGQLGNLSVHNSTPAFGGGGGAEYNQKCAFTGYLSGIRGRSGQEVDQIIGLCRTSN